MQDSPQPEQLLAAVARFLRDEAGPALAGAGQGALAYQARVAANMLDTVRRQGLLAPAAEAAELARLQALLGDGPGAGSAGSGPALNQRLADSIAAGTLTLDSLGLAEHLWQTTLAKLAVDQPGYETYRRLTADAESAGPAAAHAAVPPTPEP